MHVRIWAAALQSQCYCVVYSSPPLFQFPVSALHRCEYRLVPSYSLSALHWHLPPSSCLSLLAQVSQSSSNLCYHLLLWTQHLHSQFIFCLIIDSRSCSNIFHLQFMFDATWILWLRDLMMIDFILFKKATLYQKIPLKLLNESKEICIAKWF